MAPLQIRGIFALRPALSLATVAVALSTSVATLPRRDSSSARALHIWRMIPVIALRHVANLASSGRVSVFKFCKQRLISTLTDASRGRLPTLPHLPLSSLGVVHRRLRGHQNDWRFPSAGGLGVQPGVIGADHSMLA